MRKATRSAAAIVVLLSASGLGLGVPKAGAANATVKMVEGSPSDYKTWRFEPKEVSISVGETVTWRNEGSLQHDARTDSQEFSPLLSKGQEHKFTFDTPGRYEYYCEPHKALGMTGVIVVTGGEAPSAPAPAPAPTPTTQAGSSGAGATTTTTRAGQPTTTTAKNAAEAGAATTTTAGSADPGVTTSSGPATSPTSAPDVAGATTTTAGHGAEEAAGGDHGSGGASDEEQKSSPVGIAFAGISTLILLGVSAKLLGS